MFEIVKLALRLTGPDFDDEVTQIISDCLAELSMLGIYHGVDDDQIVGAVILYAKWKFGYSDDSERWKANYDDKISKLSFATGYGGGE